VGNDYELMFAIEETLPDGSIALIYDSDPDGGGEEVPTGDTPLPAVGSLDRRVV